MNDRYGRLNIAAVFVTFSVTFLVAGCGKRHHVENRVWTLFDIQEQLQKGGAIAGGPTLGPGMPASAVLTSQGDGTATLNVVSAFAEGKPAAFVTTELWISYGPEDVWLQPLYLQSVDGTTSTQLPPRIVDVGPKSTFYSPFWDLRIATVGGVSEDHYRSARALLDAHVPLQPIPPHTCPLRPLGANEVHGSHMIDPIWQTELQDIPEGEAWIDGTRIGLFDFGPGIVNFDPQLRTVEPLPFFLFVGPEGPDPLAYRVGAVGPLFSGRAADVTRDPAGLWTQPHFGAFWRIHLAVMPAGAGVFDVTQNPTVIPPGVDLREYQGRVALNKDCFADTAAFLTCDWLDSQSKIEAALGADNIIPTEIMGTCPFVFYDKLPVKR